MTAAGMEWSILHPRSVAAFTRHISLSCHKLTLACSLSASLEVHLPSVGRRALGGSYDF